MMNSDGMDNEPKNRSAEGLWWKRFFYNVTGADLDYEVGPNWFASVMGTGIIANAAASLPLFADRLSAFALVVWCLAGQMLARVLKSDGQWRVLNVTLGVLLVLSIIPMWWD